MSGNTFLSGRMSRRSGRWLAGFAILAAALLSGCDTTPASTGPTAQGSPSTASTPVVVASVSISSPSATSPGNTTASSAPAARASASPTSRPSASSTAPRTALTHQVAYVKALDLPGKNATIKPVEYLTGSAMKKACAADHQKATAETCNDYYIRGLGNPYGHVPLSPTATATLVDLGHPSGPCTSLGGGLKKCGATLPEFRAAITEYGTTSPILVTLTERGGVIVAIDQMFVP